MGRDGPASRATGMEAVTGNAGGIPMGPRGPVDKFVDEKVENPPYLATDRRRTIRNALI